MVPESIGKRIALLRQQNGWTQQALADRIAISRVAVSHIEMDLSIPGERTIALLAGLFKITPFELVEGTTYPHGKVERLPVTVCSYTELELNLALLRNDLAWLDEVMGVEGWPALAAAVQEKWLPQLYHRSQETFDPDEKALISTARQALLAVCKRATELNAPRYEVTP